MGIAKDAGDNLICIAEVEKDRKTSILAQSIVQELISNGFHSPRVRIDCELSELL